MIVRQIEVKHFRGIRSLCWALNGSFCCLLGPGDSCKSTILQALELALTPRWNIPFNDADFYDGDTNHAVEITVTVGDLPHAFLDDKKFGHFIRGWRADNSLRDEPEHEDGDESVLSIRLRVDDSLEPEWKVISDRDPEGKGISARDRERLGLITLGDLAERNLAWGPGSVLARLTGDVDSLAPLLAVAGRDLRRTINLPQFQEAVGKAEVAGRDLGVSPRSGYRAALDPQATRLGNNSFALHEAEVPLRQLGLGSRRLLVVGMQRYLTSLGGIALIDEVEHGLEPHRVRRLLLKLKPELVLEDDAAAAAIGGSNNSNNPVTKGFHQQVVFTTHSSVVVKELQAPDLRVVRCRGGVVQIMAIPADLQPLTRKHPEAFLGRRIIVCEGKTEMGVLRALDAEGCLAGEPLAGLGVVLVDGEGNTKGPSAALGFARLGYRVSYLGDSDEPMNPDAEVLSSEGVEAFLWYEDLSIEQRLAKDLPRNALCDLVQIAASRFESEAQEVGEGYRRIREDVVRRLQPEYNSLPASPADWLASGIPEDNLRQAIGLAAKGNKKKEKSGWFKRVDLAENLGRLLANNLPEVGQKPTGATLHLLQAWIAAND